MRLLHGSLRPLLVCLAAVSIVPLGAACAPQQPRSVVDSVVAGHVIVGTKVDQPGLGLRTAEGAMVGLDVDVARYVINHIADAHGVAHPEITFRTAPTAQRETLINNGEVDLVSASYSMNKQRDDAVDFAGPYLVTHQALLVRADETDIRGLNDLEHDKTLCSVTGSTAAKRVSEQLKGIRLQEYDTYASCVAALGDNKVDAVTTDAAILAGFAATQPGSFTVVPIVGEDGAPLSNESYGLGHAQGDVRSTTEMNAALEQMFADGAFERFLAANFGDNTAQISPGVPGSAPQGDN